MKHHRAIVPMVPGKGCALCKIKCRIKLNTVGPKHENGSQKKASPLGGGGGDLIVFLSGWLFSGQNGLLTLRQKCLLLKTSSSRCAPRPQPPADAAGCAAPQPGWSSAPGKQLEGYPQALGAACSRARAWRPRGGVGGRSRLMDCIQVSSFMESRCSSPSSRIAGGSGCINLG